MSRPDPRRPAEIPVPLCPFRAPRLGIARGALLAVLLAGASLVPANAQETSGGGSVELPRDTYDQLVNAAGSFFPKPFLEHEGADYDKYLDLNRATFFVTQAASRNMALHGGGAIVNIGSM
ncbi:MAG: SDR family oxidoreductase, partial [Holophagales bacterium]|nr:SDR family oxidoreductase [Holophagales bacterium]